MKYHNITHWEEVLNIDDIMKEYEGDKKKVLSLLKTNPQALTKIWTEILGNDTQCKMNIFQDSKYACANCQNMSHIIDTPNIGEPFVVETGGLVGKLLLLTETKVPYAYLTINNNKIKGDAFTMKVLMLWIIEDTFIIPNAIQLKTAFLCNHVGYTLYVAPTINNSLCDFDQIMNLKPSIYGILSQVIVIFNELKKLNFILGRPSVYSFLFDKKPCSFLYHDKEIKSPYTLFLADVSQSSLTVHGVHLSSDHIDVHNYTKCIDIKGDQYKVKSFFKITDIQKPGLDFYQTLLSMFESEHFYPQLQNDDKALEIFNRLLPLKDIENDDILETIWLYKDPVGIALNLL